MSGRFSLEQIAADLAAGSLISGVVVQRLNISPFRVKRGNSTLCSTLSTLSTRHGSSLSHGLLLYSFGKTVRETMAAIRLCSLRSSLVFSRSLLSERPFFEKGEPRSRRWKDVRRYPGLDSVTGHGNFV